MGDASFGMALAAALGMTSSDRIHLESNLEKFEWVAPIIRLLEAGHTLGKQFSPPFESIPEIGLIGYS